MTEGEPGGRIRALAVGLVVREDRVLVERGLDRASGHEYYRAIGGGIEFGERAAEAVVREWQEELALAFAPRRLLGVIENLFTYEGRAGHEIAFVFLGDVAEASAGDPDRIRLTESDGAEHEACWIPLATLRAGGPPLYPAGTLALLDPRTSDDA